MFRDDNSINYTNGTGGCHKETIKRQPKRSESESELKEKIAARRLSLKYGYNWRGTEAEQFLSETDKRELTRQENQTRQELSKYGRQLASLPKGQQHKVKKTYKKMSYEKIRKYVIEMIEVARTNGHNFITAEDIAHQLNVKTHYVKQVLQQLNIEGVLHQPTHRIPHDSNRDPMCNGTYSGWMANVYYLRTKES